MSRENDSNDDLATDAIPSPPRDEVLEDKNTFINDAENINTKSKTKSRSKFFRKGNKSAPTAFASVINISNANGVHVGANYNVYFNKPENSQKTNFPVTDAVMLLFNNNAPVDRKDLLFIAPHLNEEWRTAARILDYSDGQISQFYEDYIRSGVKEVIYQLLLDWIENEADSATVAKLSKALWDSGQQDAVTRWSKKNK